MSTTAVVPEIEPGETLIFTDASWDTYVRITREIVDRPSVRTSYGDGCLILMSIGAEHDAINRAAAEIVAILARELEMDAALTGSTTFKHDELRKGFEPDSSFYFAAASLIRTKKEIDLRRDPPPELVIEIDISSPSVRRLPIFAAVGVAEVWRYHAGRMRFYRLAGGRYEERAMSGVFPCLAADAMTNLLAARESTPFPAWWRMVAAEAHQ